MSEPLSSSSIRRRPRGTDLFYDAFVLELCEDSLQSALAHVRVGIHDLALRRRSDQPAEKRSDGLLVSDWQSRNRESAVELPVAGDYYPQHVRDEWDVVVFAVLPTRRTCLQGLVIRFFRHDPQVRDGRPTKRQGITSQIPNLNFDLSTWAAKSANSCWRESGGTGNRQFCQLSLGDVDH